VSVILPILAIAAIGYLVGSIPTANIVMHLFKGKDLRQIGTGNVTSTAVMIHAGKVPGFLSIIGEIFKTFACISIAYLLVGELWAYLLILVSAVVGQVWSIWLGWSGGQGQTIFVTGFLVLCPIPFLLAIAGFLSSLVITKRVNFSNHLFHALTPLTLLLAVWLNPLPLGLGYNSWAYAPVGLAFTALFLLKHRTDSDDIIQSQAWGSYSR
jgi:acyl phosphate:glycerol-3-phosphate acyltransferase